MISQLFLHVLCVSITMSVVLIFILLVWKNAVNRIDVRTWKAVCMVVLICLVVIWKPFRIFELPAGRAIQLLTANSDFIPTENSMPEEEEAVTASQDGAAISNVDVDLTSMNQKETTKQNTASVKLLPVVTTVLNAIAILWLLVVGIRMLYVWIVYLHFRKKAYHWREDEIPEHISFLLENLLAEYDITFTVGIYYSQAVSAPMILGIFVPVILLPRLDYTEEETEFILRHELMHLKKQDILLKLILCFAQTLHWFNPLVHRFCNNMNQYIEICCDYYVLENREISYRKAYGISIVRLLEETIDSGQSLILSTNFNENKESIFSRLKLIMDNTPRRKMRTGMVLLVLLIAAISSLVGISNPHTEETDAVSVDSYQTDISFENYTGYLDECTDWTEKGDFTNKDYDGDGICDRIYRTFVNDKTCNYRIDFGNGDILAMDKNVGSTGTPHIMAVDLTSDGESEIVFTLSYDKEIDSERVGSEFAVFRKNENEYEEMLLPLKSNNMDYIRTYENRTEQFPICRVTQLPDKGKMKLLCRGSFIGADTVAGRGIVLGYQDGQFIVEQE